MTKKVAIIAVIIAVMAAGIFIIRLKKKELSTVPPPQRPLVAVETARAEKGSFKMWRRYLAVLRPKLSAEIAPRLTGHLTSVLVREGDGVKKGQLLATLDDRPEKDRVSGLEAEVLAARTAYETQEAIYQRDKRLFGAKAISKETLDRSKSARDAARARLVSLEKSLASAKTDMSYTRLAAPFDGVITGRYQDPGDLAVPAKAVVSMEAPKAGFYLEAKVPQSELCRIKKGALVRLLPGRNDLATLPEVTVTRLHPAVTKGSLAAIEADISKRPFGLPSGSTIMVDIETGQATGFRLPLRSLLENTNGTWIYLVDNQSRIHITKVDVLWKGPEFAVVSSQALKPGTWVVVAQESALLRLHQGQRVYVAGDARGN